MLSREVELARQLVFNADIGYAIPSRISVYITRREPDLDTSSYKNRKEPYIASFSDQWDDKYRNSDSNVKNLVTTVVNKAEKEFPNIGTS